MGKLRAKFNGYFGADFIAAAANRGADGGKQVGGFCAELHLHMTNGLHGDAMESAAPACMDGGDGAIAFVHEEDRDAVGGLHGKKHVWVAGDGGVAVAGFGSRGVEAKHRV